VTVAIEDPLKHLIKNQSRAVHQCHNITLFLPAYSRAQAVMLCNIFLSLFINKLTFLVHQVNFERSRLMENGEKIYIQSGPEKVRTARKM